MRFDRLLVGALIVFGLGGAAPNTLAAEDGPVTITGHVATNTLISGVFQDVPVGAPVRMFFSTRKGGFDPFWGPTGHFCNVDEISFELHIGTGVDERVAFSGSTSGSSLLFVNAGFVTTAVTQCVFEFFQMQLDTPGYSVYFKAQDDDASCGWTTPLVCGLPASTPSSAFNAAEGSWWVRQATNQPVTPAPEMNITFDGALTVAPRQCPADFNESSTLTVQDIFDFLNAWFAGCTGGSSCQSRTADFNCSNTLSVQDIFDFLSAWFAGC